MIFSFQGTPLDDVIIGSKHCDVISGGFGNDTIRSLAGDDLVFGNAGNDYIYGYLGNDLLIGGDGHDALYGEQGDDTLSGGTGDDDLIGGDGNDVLEGNSQNDYLHGGAGADTIDGGSGIDTLSYYNSPAGVVVNLHYNTATGGHATGDVISNVENILGSGHADILVGDNGANHIKSYGGNDVILGLAGNDIILPGTGNDVVNGGIGFDIVSFEDYESGNGFVVDLGAGTATRATYSGFWFSYEKDLLYNIEGVIGSEGNDTITGDGSGNTLEGNFGDDVLNGAVGNDTLNGGSGYDTMTGGLGADSFVFTVDDRILNNRPEWGIITDFNASEGDKIDLSEVTYMNRLEFIGGADFSGTGGAEVRIAQQGFGTAIIHVDVDGDGGADGIIEVTVGGLDAFGADDFIL